MNALLHAHSLLMDSRYKLEVDTIPTVWPRTINLFYERFFKGMTSAEKKEFLVSCQKILNRLE